MVKKMTSLERTLTALSQKEPDRVPLFLLLSMYGAKELAVTIEEYFSNPKNVVEGQLRMRKKYANDCIYTFFYASIETEAWGGETIFLEDGPPNSGEPFISKEDIKNIEIPKISEDKGLKKVLETTRLLKEKIGNEAPIIGVAVSPFSIPVMQMGFDKYIDLIYENEDVFWELMKINQEFCTAWSNAQIEAGADAICYFDPVSSPTILPRNKYLQTGFKVAKSTIARINAPTATHMASGRVVPIIDDLVETGTGIIGVSGQEDIGEIKKKCKKRLAVLGNMKGIEMHRWDEKKVEKEIKDIIYKAGKGGGLIISDNHGEIPLQVSEETLLAISEAVREWGEYPLEWIKNYGK